VESKATSDIVDITNQSSKEGIRIVLDLKKGADIEALENLLYKKTKLEDTFGVNMLAVADGRPETMGIVAIIRHHVKFQYEIATRKYRTLLQKELDKKEIQEGLIRACNVIDLIIEILRGSRNIKDAKACLTTGETENIKFKNPASKVMAQQLNFTDRQAQAILDMRLYKLIGLEIEALMKEHDETLANIGKYEDILEHRTSMAKVIIKELQSFKKAYSRERRTVIDNLKEAVVAEKKIEEQDVVVLIDRFGYAKAIDTVIYERNRENANAESRYVVACKNTDKICIFTDKGQLHLLKVLDLPYGKFRDKGTPIDNLCNYDSKTETFIYVASLQEVSENRLVFGTKQAMLKVVEGAEFVVSKKTTVATKLADSDEVLAVRILTDNNTLVMCSKKDMFLRIACDQIPQKKKAALGVRGMKLGAGDELKEIYVMRDGENPEMEVRGKTIALSRLHIGSRDTKGVKK
jgi:DNA gyrase subunit A